MNIVNSVWLKYFGYRDLIHFTVTASHTFALNALSATKMNALLMRIQ